MKLTLLILSYLIFVSTSFAQNTVVPIQSQLSSTSFFFEEESAEKLPTDMPFLLAKMDNRLDSDTSKRKVDTTIIQMGNMKIIIKGKEEDFDVEIEESEIPKNEMTLIQDEDNRSGKEKRNVNTRWVMMDLGVNSYLNDGSTNLPKTLNDFELNIGKSIEVNLHLFKQRINLVNHQVNLMYGMTFQFNNYRFSNEVTLLPRKEQLTIIPIEDALRKSKLSATYLNVPLTLNFETNTDNKKKSFRFNAGGYAGYLLGAHTKLKFANDSKSKARDDFNLNKLHYGMTAQIGYGWFNIYGRYSLTPLFNENEGPDLTPVSMGIVIIGF